MAMATHAHVADQRRPSARAPLRDHRRYRACARKPISASLPLVCANAAASLKGEPECLRFDVLTPLAGGDEVLLYEVYRDRAAFERISPRRTFWLSMRRRARWC